MACSGRLLHTPSTSCCSNISRQRATEFPRTSRAHRSTLLRAEGEQQSAEPEGWHPSKRGSGVTINGRSTQSPLAWSQLVTQLKEHNVKALSLDDMENALRRSVPLIDIRESKLFDAESIDGSVNIPLFRQINGWSPMQTARKIGFFMFGMLEGTEINGDFVQEVEEVVPDKTEEIMLMCSLGAQPFVKQAEELKVRQTRSMIAAYQLVQAGYSNVRLSLDGFRGWADDGRQTMVPID